MIEDFPVPSADKTLGAPGHVEDSNKVHHGLAVLKAAVSELEQHAPRIVGTVGDEEDLPTTGETGEMYFVGQEGDLWGWNEVSLEWEYVGNLRGPEGPAGTAGTILGKLNDPLDLPPVGTPIGSLWWVPEEGATVPGPDYTPAYVGGTATESNTTSLNMSMSSIAGAADDIAVMVVAANTPDNFTVNQTGWNAVTGAAKLPNAGAGPNIKVFTKTLSGGEGNFTITKDTAGGVRIAAAIMVFRNVVLTAGQPITYGYASAGAVTTVSAPTVTPSLPSIVCGFLVEGPRTGSGAWTLTPPTQFTVGPTGAVHQGTSGGAMTVGAAYDLDVAEDAARPVTSGHQWVASRTTDGDTHIYTIALEQKS